MERNETNKETEKEADEIEDSPMSGYGHLFEVTQSKKTFLRQKKGMTQLFNFSLKKIADVNSSASLKGAMDGMWAFELRRETSLRKIALTSGAFMSRINLRNQLSPICPGEFLDISAAVTPEILSKYIQWLDRDFSDNSDRALMHASHIGFQDDQTLVLSNKIQIKNKVSIAEINKRFLVIGGELELAGLSIDPALLDCTYLQSFFSKLISYSAALQCNSFKYLQALSFAALRIFKASDQEMAADEAKYACLVSKERNVGKTTTLRSIAKGSGIQNPSNHMFMMSGGDGFLNGVSSKMQEKIFAMTNLVVIVNEISMNKVISGMLNQCHDGLCSGSKNAGLTSAKATIIGSSNDNIHEKLDGRMVEILYGPLIRHDEVANQMIKELRATTENNTGFLLAWCCQYIDFWNVVKERMTASIRQIVFKYLPDKQWRYVSSLSGNILVLFMFYVTSGKQCDVIELFQKLIVVQCHDSFPKRFAKDILDAIKASNELATWINPFTRFSCNEKEYDSLAIRVTKITSFSRISSSELSLFLERYGKKAYKNVNARFCGDGKSAISDLHIGTLTENRKCYKMPWLEIPSQFRASIRAELGLPHNSEGGVGPVESESGSFSKEDKNELLKLFRELETLFQQYFSTNASSSSDDWLDETAKKLTPMKRKFYQDLSPNSRNVFQMGYDAASTSKRRRKLDVEGGENTRVDPANANRSDDEDLPSFRLSKES